MEYVEVGLIIYSIIQSRMIFIVVKLAPNWIAIPININGIPSESEILKACILVYKSGILNIPIVEVKTRKTPYEIKLQLMYSAIRDNGNSVKE